MFQNPVLNEIGKKYGKSAARTSAYYAVAPFIAAILSLIIFREIPDVTYFVALVLMIVGAWLSSQDKPLIRKVKNE